MQKPGLPPVAGALLMAAAIVVPLARQGARPWHTLWAEDGRLYVQDANAMPLHATLFRGYAGYGQLLSRLLAIPTRYLPVGSIPSYMALAGAATAALLALFVYRMSRTHVDRVWARLGLAGSCILVPVLALENEATVVNVAWLLMFATFWALVSRNDSRLDVGTRAAVAFLAPATCPIAALFLPLLAVVLWARRQRTDAVVGAAFVAGIAVQAAMVLTTDATTPATTSTVADLAVLYPVRVVASALVGEAVVRDLWPRWGNWIGIAAVVVVTGLAAAGLRRVGLDRSRTAIAAIALSFPLFAVPVVLRGTLGMRLLPGVYNANGARYAVVPVLLLVSGAAVLCAQNPRRWLPAAFAAQVVVVGLTSVSGAGDWRPTGPAWADSLREARATCATSSQQAGALAIAPLGWSTALSCSRLG